MIHLNLNVNHNIFHKRIQKNDVLLLHQKENITKLYTENMFRRFSYFHNRITEIRNSFNTKILRFR